MVNLLGCSCDDIDGSRIAGIGKTTIAAKLIERFMHRKLSATTVVVIGKALVPCLNP